MIFHLGFELPEPPSQKLDHESPDLTGEETRILKSQIRKNAKLIDVCVERLDLLVNKERHPGRTASVQKLRKRLELLMEENDTFRKVLWKHFQSQDLTDNLN